MSMRGYMCVCMCAISPTKRGVKAMTAKLKIKDPDVYPPSSFSSSKQVHRLQVHKHKASLFLSRNVKTPLECDLMLTEAPLSESIYA